MGRGQSGAKRFLSLPRSSVLYEDYFLHDAPFIDQHLEANFAAGLPCNPVELQRCKRPGVSVEFAHGVIARIGCKGQFGRL